MHDVPRDSGELWVKDGKFIMTIIKPEFLIGKISGKTVMMPNWMHTAWHAAAKWTILLFGYVLPTFGNAVRNLWEVLIPKETGRLQVCLHSL